MKRMIGILLAAALSFGVLAMVGCGGDDGPVDTDTTKVVKVWLHKSQAEPEGKVYRALQDLFNEADYKTTDGRDIVMSIEYKNSSDALSTAISAIIPHAIFGRWILSSSFPVSTGSPISRTAASSASAASILSLRNAAF